MKTLQELKQYAEKRAIKESTDVVGLSNDDMNKVGVITNLADPITIRNVKYFAKQISNAAQPDPATVFAKIEDELNKYGYTLGDIEGGFETAGSEDFVLYRFPDGEMIRNVALSVMWEKTNQVQVPVAKDILSYDFRVSLNVIDPNKFDSLLAGDEVEFEDDDLIDGDELYGDDDTDYVSESAEPKGTDYQKLVKKMMDRKGIKSIEDLTGEQKKDFFNTLDKSYNSKDEPGKDGETLEELSKKTLGSYVKKASKDMATSSQLQGAELQKRNQGVNPNETKGMSNTDKAKAQERHYKAADKNAKYYGNIRNKRSAGISKAVNKMSESTELQEAVSISGRGQVRIVKSGNDKLDANISGSGLTLIINGESINISKADLPKFTEKFTEFLLDYV